MAPEATPVQAGDSGAPLLRIRHLSKTFPGTRALSGVSLDVGVAEVHAIVGQNGSGKSTLIKVLAGYHQPDPGASAEFDGMPLELGGSGGANERLRFVHQDLGLVLELSALENLALHGGFQRMRSGRVDWRAQGRHTNDVLERFGVDLDIDRPLAEATPVERTVVAIAGALQGWHGGRGVLVLDEPTAVLPHDEVERLFGFVREVQRAGTSVIYVSHRLGEIFEIASRVTVLRGGRRVDTLDVADIDPAGLAALMVGEQVDPDYRAPVSTRPEASVVLEASDLHGRWLRGTSLEVHRGEILGIAGLAGAGVHELPYAITGAAHGAVSGRIRMPERSGEWLDVSDAGSLGIPLLPADRAKEAVIAEFSVGENITLSVLSSLGRRARLGRGAESALVARWVERLEIVTSSPAAPISTLSGGNQQKVVLARCLVSEPDIIVLCEPTAGVDIGTRVAIYDLMARLARDGLTVIVSSSDLGDLLAMCTRVVVLQRGRVTATFNGDGLNEQTLVQAVEMAA